LFPKFYFLSRYESIFSFSLSLEFRTTARHGLLWAWANFKRYTKYLHLVLERGFLQFEVKGNQKPRILQYKARRLNDGQWHLIRLDKRDQIVQLQVASEKWNAPSPKTTRKRMFVGGLIGRHRKLLEGEAGDGDTSHKDSELLSPPGFSGCIRHFVLDGVERALLASSRDLVPCTHARDVAYIHDGGFARFESLQNHSARPTEKAETTRAEVEFALNFRSLRHSFSSLDGRKMTSGTEMHPNEENTRKKERNRRSRAKKDDSLGILLVALLRPKDNGWLSIMILNNTLFLSVRLPKFDLIFEELFDESRVASTSANASLTAHFRQTDALTVCPGQWHRMSFRLGTRSGTFVLDDVQVEFPSRVPQMAIDEMRAFSVLIGGVNGPISESLGGTRSMVGCVKQLELSGVPVSMGNAQRIHKVVPDGCPFL